MEPIIVDPFSYDRILARKDAERIVTEFCSFHDLSEPQLHDDLAVNHKWGKYGWCSRKSLFCSLGRSPVKKPGYSWTFTGYKADLTSYGIMSHELGHWWAYSLGRDLMTELEDTMKSLREPAISGYDRSVPGAESIAEATRLMILNPDLLEKGRPDRYKLLQSYGMEPLHSATWQGILVNAHPKIISAAKNWMV